MQPDLKIEFSQGSLGTRSQCYCGSVALALGIHQPAEVGEPVGWDPRVSPSWSTTGLTAAEKGLQPLEGQKDQENSLVPLTDSCICYKAWSDEQPSHELLVPKGM